jgi:riboflavin kinase/FMN adenylyltransferase
MRIYYNLDDFTRLDNAVVTSGTFDGVHLGHQKILKRLKEIAQKNGGETVVITFWPHPRLILKPEEDIQHLLRLTFTKEFSQITSLMFIKKILVDTIGTGKLVIGYDHRFGNNREGSFEQLKVNAPTYGFEVEEIERQDIDHVGVSSSKIRHALENGDVETANHFLGRPYSIMGSVVKGDKLGRILGYPTANIELDSRHKLIPSDGIYAVTVRYESVLYKVMLYIGNRPTVNGTKRVIEVNLFNFDRVIYGENLTVHFHSFIRLDSKFSDLEALKQQLLNDKSKALAALENVSL